MKIFPFLVLFLTLTAGMPGLLRAQTNDGTAARLSFLSAGDREHYLKVRQQVLGSHPDLKTEQESLEKERQSLQDNGTTGSQEDRRALLRKLLAHNKKIHDAMLKADPSIAPVLDQIDAKMKDRFKQHVQESGAGSGSN